MTDSLYDIGHLPPLGEVPKQMYASLIRPERFGEPKVAFQTEVVDTPTPGRGEVLVMVMAAGINYNNVWAALGSPVDVIGARQKMGATEDFHIGGSEGSGVVWAVGEGVTSVSVGDHVVLSGCQWDENADDIRFGADPMTSKSQRVWGYELNWGTFAQYTLVHDYQCHPKPARLTWEEAACYMLTGATAYRQLCGWDPHVVNPGDPVLIWGGAGGLGSMAIQITRLRGGIPIAVVSSDERAEYCMKLGAEGVIDRRNFDHWGRLPDVADADASLAWTKSARAFGKEIWKILGEKKSPKIVLEHSGQSTIPTSMFVCDTAGMVVICGGTSGYNGDLDLRHLWMRQKRLQGSHFANLRQCRDITAWVASGTVDPCLSHCGSFEDIGGIHQQMFDNNQPAGNLAVLINSPAPSLIDMPALDLESTLEPAAV